MKTRSILISITKLSALLFSASLLLFSFFFRFSQHTFAVAPSNGTWSSVGSLSAARGGFSATLLQNGKVLVAAGFSNSSSLIPYAELYDPNTRTWTTTGSLNVPRMTVSPAMVTLQNGKALIAGGSDINNNDYASAELYDPATGIWTNTGSLNTPRRSANMMLLNDGRVIIAGGSHGPPDGSRFLHTTEIYDPNSGTWSYGGNLSYAHEGGRIIKLQDGRVLIAGGEDPWLTLSDVAEIFDPTTNTWSSAGTMPYAWGGASMVLLADGKVLVVGGGNSNGVLANSAIYDPTQNSWTATAPMNTARANPMAFLLNDGRVMVAGGGLQSSEIYDPATNTWSSGPQLTEPRDSPIVSLANGDILAMGGGGPGGTLLASAEVYSNPIPTGKWLSPTGSFTIQQGKSITLGIQADPSQGGAPVDHVNINAWWKGIDPKNWINIGTITTPDSGTTDHYTLKWNFKVNGNYIPESPVEFSFDVADKAGNIAYRADGVREGMFVSSTPLPPSTGPYVTLSVSTDQITCVDTLTFSVKNATADEIRISENGVFITKLPGNATTYPAAPQNVTKGYDLYEVAAFSQTHFLALARIFAPIAAYCAQGTPPKAPIPPMPDSQNDLFVLVQGINSCLHDNSIIPPVNCDSPPEGTNGYGYSPSFEDYRHIAGSLMWNGYLNSRFIVYSYTGSYYDGMPNSYTCQDTWQNTIQDDALQLGKQIAAAVNGNKNIRVHLIGHSLAGAVMTTYVAALLYGLYNVPGLPDMHQLVDVNVLDGALGGMTNDSKFIPWLVNIEPFLCSGASSYTSENQLTTQFASATDPKHLGQTASAFPLFLGSTTFVANQQIFDDAHNQWGTTVDVIGNLKDYLWKPYGCIGVPNFPSTEFVKDEGSGVFSRVFSSGIDGCKTSALLNGLNHSDVLNNGNVNKWVLQIVEHVPNPVGLNPYTG